MQKKPSVLLVEDSAELSTVFAEILEMYGLAVRTIDDGADAMAWLKDGSPDLIVLDMHLPRVSGLEILNYIRTAPHLAKTKVLAITGNALLTVDLEEKADLVLLKPFTMSQIGDFSIRLLNIGAGV